MSAPLPHAPLPHAVSLRPPHPSWVIEGAPKDGHQDVLPLTYFTMTTGWLLIHAGRTDSRRHRKAVTPDMARGGIVGAVRVVACVPSEAEASRMARRGYTRGIGGRTALPETWEAAWRSPWWAGPFGLLVRDPVPLPFEPCRGRLGVFDPELSAEATTRVRAALAEALAARGLDGSPPVPAPDPVLTAATAAVTEAMTAAMHRQHAASTAPEGPQHNGETA
ncbi:hypothetical protein F1188_18265 [Roseospira marina]|uniref:Pyridoxamine 5'-phosphate oxidase family protein n=1 Tax=Roseospira marina TaxID=140057 RepID=A0A5M6I6Y4_9PROT|nr:hypothetical protein [Roseospira marina]KAA5603966.1 hypothetical protein F1188_18265 [Roseospira marina]MBB4315936.1 hypothetical protein [Roseospira marina]MBB5089103.1 hypothetical protein [Roseospira marina]